ncbi:hypothetical protein DL764_002298 [Monosporascus ibericus]|uniref:SnoaL-like domain-containing protein n=1 Tax=Monosporascus ibericus TaxID=155417 RepID=A0A4Q4TQR4_9PEZI|nr:hypothetical protein DL764_002298 [Monosporascus ibericus]
MASIRLVYESLVRCINDGQWEDLPRYMHQSCEINGRAHSPESYVAEMRTGGVSEILLDAVTVDEKTQRLASTVLVKWKPSKDADGFNATGKTVQFMEQRLNWFVDGKLSNTITLADRDAIHHQLSDSMAHYAPDFISNQPDAVEDTRPSSDLESTYRAYIDSINKRTMESDLRVFCHPQVVHNNKALALDNYRQLMQDAITVMPDINFGIHTLIVDEEAQRVAARLEFTGTPVKGMRDVQPTGRSVHFAEHVTYQFRGGKIARVWSVVDWVSYREQLLEK